MKSSTQFVCQQCGYSTPRWMGQCPGCGQWNTLVETVVSEQRTKGIEHRMARLEPVKLSSVKRADYQKRTSTGIGELDRVLGGGIVSGMVTLIAGEPGIGKSTLLLELAGKVAGDVIYIAGEESATQIASRAARLGVKGDNVAVLEETDVDAVVSSLSNLSNLSLAIIDSIQTLTTGDLTGVAGSIGQVRECASRLSHFAKTNNVPVFMVGHVTKEGTIAGPRVLEHMVDTVLWFEGERAQALRIVRAVKNRFGRTDEVGVFTMEEKGLTEVSNPSGLFLGDQKGVPGSVVTAVLEGTRVLLVEIQALVVPTKLAFPKRMSSGTDPRRLELLVAVLARRAGLPLWDFDIFVNVAGGIKIEEPAADLAIALSVASAFQDKPVGESITGSTSITSTTGEVGKMARDTRGTQTTRGTVVAIGEIGLLGEIREVPMQERRTKEARRLGFRNTVTRKEVRTVGEAVRKYISSK